MMLPVSGWFTVRVLQALCAALALLVSPGLQLAHAHTVSDPRAPSGRASAGGGRVVDEGSDQLHPRAPLDRWRRLPDKEGAGGAQPRDSAASNDRGRHQSTRCGSITVSTRRWSGSSSTRSATSAAYAARSASSAVRSRHRPPIRSPSHPHRSPTDLGGYKYTAFGRLLPPDAGTPTPTALGQALSQPMRWQGRWFEEETGLYDFRNRVWSPELGAFLSPDEFVFHTEGTLWSWPGQNPMRYRDPWGLVVPLPSPQPSDGYFGIPGVFTFTEVGLFMFSSALDAAKAGNYGDAALDAASGSAALILAETNLALEAWAAVGMPGLGAALGPKACPPNLSTPGAARSGAFRAAKFGSGVPRSQSPSAVLPNVDKAGNPQPGRIYEFTVPKAGGGTQNTQIREDSAGHFYGSGNEQNRGPHFNDPYGGHYDY